MATTQSPARRVLSDLNVNSTLSPRKSYKPYKFDLETQQKDGVIGKRPQVEAFSAGSSPAKRRRSNGPLLEPSSSPASSTADTSYNTTQLTAVTEPDSPHPRTIPRNELRQRAEAMKLRLRLANYKVETKQINVPLSQLRLETKTSKPSNLPRFSPSLTTGKPRTPLPDTIPDIRIRRPSSETAHPATHMPSSPPPRYLEIVSGSNISPRKEELVTPLLPRQREDIAGRLAGESPTRKDPSGRDLTSSIVKQKTAADSLLDLMRQSDYSRSF